MPRTIADIQVALRMCEDTLTVENKHKTVRSRRVFFLFISYPHFKFQLREELLKKKRQTRSIKLAEAKFENENKRKKIQEQFTEKETEIRNQFDQFEKSIESTWEEKN